MCAIVDTNVISEVIRGKTEAGIKFKDWLENRKGKLIVGGKNLKELSGDNDFKRWFLEMRRSGVVEQIRNELIQIHQSSLDQRNDLKSNDSHVLALAIESGARLLYTNDGNLIKDFSNKNIISGPLGKIYTTKEIKGQIVRGTFRQPHKKLLNNKNLCKNMISSGR